tara:strand:+ start:131 stop:382 length:252 start_codon:yes stop_codon:yes gene_type:complete
MEKTFETLGDVVERRSPGRPPSQTAQDAAKWLIEQNDLGQITTAYAACKKFGIKSYSTLYNTLRAMDRGDIIQHLTTKEKYLK